MARILGLGGVFFKATNPARLGDWYAKWLGLDVAKWGGVVFPVRWLPPRGYAVWSPFEAKTDYFRPSRKPFLVNLVVDDLDAMLAKVAKSGARVMPKREESEFGRFGWFVDPEGNKVELWEPPRPKKAARKKK
jgi:predicted enzyme related to lactoylglutathione lyase